MEDLKLARNQTSETKEAVVDLDVLEVKEIKSVPKTVEVRAKIDIEFYFGDAWVYMKKGQTYKVSQELKNYLAERNALDVL